MDGSHHLPVVTCRLPCALRLPMPHRPPPFPGPRSPPRPRQTRSRLCPRFCCSDRLWPMARLLTPFRAMGFVTGDVPAAVARETRVTSEHKVLTAVGRGWHEYSASNLLLICNGPQLPEDVRAVAKQGALNVAGAGTKIYVFQNKSLMYTLEHSPIGHVTHLLLAHRTLVSVGYDNTMAVWHVDTAEQLQRMTFPHGSTCNCVCVPTGYVNKVPCVCGGGWVLCALYPSRRSPPPPGDVLEMLTTPGGWGVPPPWTPSPDPDFIGGNNEIYKRKY